MKKLEAEKKSLYDSLQNEFKVNQKLRDNNKKLNNDFKAKQKEIADKINEITALNTQVANLTAQLETEGKKKRNNSRIIRRTKEKLKKMKRAFEKEHQSNSKMSADKMHLNQLLHELEHHLAEYEHVPEHAY